ncbi:stage III sporulation protein AF [Alkalithermobacter thermoalcaliphilus JW-YL-7 = DSM 7308]|uniref:Sporulation stage III protein AF n=1 Tax=Alkalithermobacter thermoalcaliphilus JW-YL-7 = DSM 7308 TaxID=1121328 RepID=A0A150FQZ8_CLOPD|nr:Sporulation stage III protein AF [[Clostridium] paradoxum JW-YL-7 = DSM 7308]SHK94951.1 stage III sporulation protein AF [[Clostridium] paradoxum JW-YL-7 = DSM 7308]
MSLAKEIISSILIGAFIVNIINLIIPNGNLKPYVNLVLSFVFICIIITPISNIISKDMDLQDKILQKYNSFQYEYYQSSSKLGSNVNIDQVEKNYSNYLREVLNIKLKEHGYEVEEIEVKDNEIKNLVLKETNFKENSNNDEDEKIKLKQNENYKEAFKNGNTINKDNLKEEINQIFKISIDKIKIN